MEMEHNKEISQLRKEQRIKDSTIKTLEAEKRQKELILKRKQEEVTLPSLSYLKYSTSHVACTSFSSATYLSKHSLLAVVYP